MDEVPRGFARDEDELAPLFEEDVCGTEDGGICGTGGDASEGAHGAGADDHGIKASGAAGEGHVHGTVSVLVDGWRDVERSDLFLDDLFCVVTEDEMDLVVLGGDEVEQSLEIDCAAGSGGCDDQFHEV